MTEEQAEYKVVDKRPNFSETMQVPVPESNALVMAAINRGLSPEMIEKEGYDIYNKKSQLSLRPSKRELFKNAVSDLIFPSSPFALKGLMNIHKVLEAIMIRVIEDQHRSPQIPFFSIAYNLHKKMNHYLPLHQYL